MRMYDEPGNDSLGVPMRVGDSVSVDQLRSSGGFFFEKNGLNCAIVDFGPRYLGFIVDDEERTAEVAVSGYDRNWVGDTMCEETLRRSVAILDEGEVAFCARP